MTVAMTIVRRLSARLASALPVILPLALLAFAPQARGDIAIDHSSAASARSRSRSLTWKHTLGAGADRAVVVSVAIADRRRHNADITSVTFDGVAMQAVPHSYAADGGPRVLETQLFSLTGAAVPGPGRYTVAVRFDDEA